MKCNYFLIIILISNTLWSHDENKQLEDNPRALNQELMVGEPQDDNAQEEQLRDAFLGLLTFIEVLHDADKVAQELDNFFTQYQATPFTKIRDIGGSTSPKISLLRFTAHTARLDGQEGKFALLQAMLKRGGDPFVVEEGERFSLADENALCCVHLCNCKKTGYLPIFDYDNAPEELQEKALRRQNNMCHNAKRIQAMFEEFAQ